MATQPVRIPSATGIASTTSTNTATNHRPLRQRRRHPNVARPRQRQFLFQNEHDEEDDEDYATWPLFVACLNCYVSLQLIQSLVEAYPFVLNENVVDLDGNTALHLACKSGHSLDVIRFLTTRASSSQNFLKTKNYFGSTPLSVLIRSSPPAPAPSNSTSNPTETGTAPSVNSMETMELDQNNNCNTAKQSTQDSNNNNNKTDQDDVDERLQIVMYLVEADPGLKQSPNEMTLLLLLACSAISIHPPTIRYLMRSYPNALAQSNSSGILPLHLLLSRYNNTTNTTTRNSTMISVQIPTLSSMYSLLKEMIQLHPQALKHRTREGMPLHIAAWKKAPLPIVQLIYEAYPLALDMNIRPVSRTTRVAVNMNNITNNQSHWRDKMECAFQNDVSHVIVRSPLHLSMMQLGPLDVIEFLAARYSLPQFTCPGMPQYSTMPSQDAHGGATKIIITTTREEAFESCWKGFQQNQNILNNKLALTRVTIPCTNQFSIRTMTSILKGAQNTSSLLVLNLAGNVDSHQDADAIDKHLHALLANKNCKLKKLILDGNQLPCHWLTALETNSSLEFLSLENCHMGAPSAPKTTAATRTAGESLMSWRSWNFNDGSTLSSSLFVTILSKVLGVNTNLRFLKLGGNDLSEADLDYLIRRGLRVNTGVRFFDIYPETLGTSGLTALVEILQESNCTLGHVRMNHVDTVEVPTRVAIQAEQDQQQQQDNPDQEDMMIIDNDGEERGGRVRAGNVVGDDNNGFVVVFRRGPPRPFGAENPRDRIRRAGIPPWHHHFDRHDDFREDDDEDEVDDVEDDENENDDNDPIVAARRRDRRRQQQRQRQRQRERRQREQHQQDLEHQDAAALADAQRQQALQALWNRAVYFFKLNACGRKWTRTTTLSKEGFFWILLRHSLDLEMVHGLLKEHPPLWAM